MERSDLDTKKAKNIIDDLNKLITKLYSKNLYMSSWTGTFPTRREMINRFLAKIFGFPYKSQGIGLEQRLNYQPLPEAADDGRFPWFLYWEIYWVIKNTREYLYPGARVLDAGGASSLFSCYLASLGFDVHSVDLSKSLVKNANHIAKKLQWNMHAYVMDMKNLDFLDEYFDHVYSICVFEHLDYAVKKAALEEIVRCLKTGGILSITFDYRNPAPGVVGYGKDTRPRNQIKKFDDINRNFLSNANFELIGNYRFFDTRDSYLVHPRFNNTPYTFGALFLRKKVKDF